MRIGSFDTDSRVLVVAEVGNNHEGDPAVARRLITAMAEAGVDAVKLQVFRTEHYVSLRDAERFARLKSFELRPDDVLALAAYAHELGLLFIATPLDLQSVAMLERTVDAFKVASGDITFMPLLDTIAATRAPVVLSSGGSTLDEIRTAISRVRSAWSVSSTPGELAVLHCVSSYPVPIEQANLAAIPGLAQNLGVTVGYSDHVIGVEASLAAVALGARIIEKHVTVDRHYSDFRDHQLSLEPDEMRILVDRIRIVGALLGTGAKVVQPCERDSIGAIRRSIAAARDLVAGGRVARADVTWLRPQGGLRPGTEDAVVGRTLRRAIRAGDPITEDDLDGTV
jgi:N,N'-diacetyllegionaminate synthase